jgi:hypothetical protein
VGTCAYDDCCAHAFWLLEIRVLTCRMLVLYLNLFVQQQQQQQLQNYLPILQPELGRGHEQTPSSPRTRNCGRPGRK